MDTKLNKLRYISRWWAPVCAGSIFKLPFEDGCFDAVVCSQVIEHVTGTAWIGEFRRVLHEGGALVLGTPDYGTWWPLVERVYRHCIPGGYANEHVTHFTRDGICKLLAASGFEFVRAEYICRAELVAMFRKRC